MMGLSQSSLTIYFPVWVDHFAPPHFLTLWLGLAQGAVVVGTVVSLLLLIRQINCLSPAAAPAADVADHADADRGAADADADADGAVAAAAAAAG